MNRGFQEKDKAKGVALFDLLVALLIASIISVLLISLQIRNNQRVQYTVMKTNVSILMTSVVEILRSNASEGGDIINRGFQPGATPAVSCGLDGGALCTTVAAFTGEKINEIQREVNRVFPATVYGDQFILCVAGQTNSSFADGGNYRLLAVWSSNLSQEAVSAGTVQALGTADCPASFVANGNTDPAPFISAASTMVFSRDGVTDTASAYEMYTRVR